MSTKVSSLTQATNAELAGASLTYLVTDPSGTPASKKSSLSRIGLPTGWVDEIQACAGTQTLQAGNVQHGSTFIRLRSGQTATGVRFWWDGGVGAQTVTIELFEYPGDISTTGTSVASGTVSCSAQGIYSGTFSSAYTLLAGKVYAATWVNANYWSLYSSLAYLGSRDRVRFRDYTIIDGGVYKSGGGAGAPTVSLGTASYNVYLIEPVISG